MKRIESDVSAHHTVSSPEMTKLRNLADESGAGETSFDNKETLSESGSAFLLGVKATGTCKCKFYLSPKAVCVLESAC